MGRTSKLSGSDGSNYQSCNHSKHTQKHNGGRNNLSGSDGSDCQNCNHSYHSGKVGGRNQLSGSDGSNCQNCITPTSQESNGGRNNLSGSDRSDCQNCNHSYHSGKEWGAQANPLGVMGVITKAAIIQNTLREIMGGGERQPLGE